MKFKIGPYSITTRIIKEGRRALYKVTIVDIRTRGRCTITESYGAVIATVILKWLATATGKNGEFVQIPLSPRA